MTQMTGRCFCGRTVSAAVLMSKNIGVCHCKICRQQTAGPFFAVDCGNTLDFSDYEALGVYDSSDRSERLFRMECGSLIAWRTQDKSMKIVSTNVFDETSCAVLDHEVFVDHKPKYYSFALKTMQLTEAGICKMFSQD